jgi:hypothetical protein
VTNVPLPARPPVGAPDGTAGAATSAASRRWPGVAAAGEALRRAFVDWTTFDIAAAMTCLLLVSYAESLWFIRIPALALGVVGIVYRPLTRRATYWLVASALLIAGYWVIWYTIDNHKYLTAYWCLALALSLLTSRPLRAAAVNARLLIGLCFLLATVWKLTSLEFVDGTFFHFSLITDPRFRTFTDVIGGVGADLTTANGRMLSALARGESVPPAIAFNSSERVELLARLMAIWTIAIEGLVAAAFLWPEGRGLSRWRDAILLVFVITTYPIASVPGFAWLLVAMGMAQSVASPAWVRPAYVFTYALLPLFLLPFGHIIGKVLGS